MSPIPEPDPVTPEPPSSGPHQSPTNPFRGVSPTLSQTLNLAEAIALLANNIKSPKKSPSTKIREPDTFNGSDSRKLQPYLVQCTLNFRDHPDAFSSDSAKVTYTLSYLKGTALDWLKPSLCQGMTHL